MNTKKKRNRIILCICSILVLFASIFAVIPFNKDTKIVKADTIVNDVVFTSSKIIVPTAKYTYKYNNGTLQKGSIFGLNSYNSVYDFAYLSSFFNVDFRYNQDDGRIQFKLNIGSFELIDGTYISNSGYVIDNGSVRLNYLSNNFSDYKNGLTGVWHYLDDWKSVSGERILVTFSGNYTSLSNNNVEVPGILFRLEYSGTLDISKMVYLRYSLDNTFSSSGESRYNLSYFDSNGNSVNFIFFCGSWDTVLSPRTYYFNIGNFTDNEYYNQGFEQGKYQGYIEGEKVGLDKGYQDGFEAGEDSGYWDGYEQALINDDRYNFTNLIASVIDVPVKTFTSLFNFEILGVNLSGFFLGLLTCCIVIGVIRLIL